VAPLLTVRSISRHYGNVIACDAVDLSIGEGEVHGLIGENGAGKSTLVKMIYGLVRPDAGRIVFNHQKLHNHSPVIARRAGVSLVFQHFALIDALTVFENVRLSLSDEGDLLLLRGRLEALAQKYSLHVDMDRTVSTLSVSEKQRIEILRCLLQSPRLLMMDEPTSVLTPQEIEGLLTLIGQIAADGCSVLFISHKLREVKSVCDRMTVMRKGRVVHHGDVEQVDVETMAEHMIGTRLQNANAKAETSDTTEILTVRGLNQSRRLDTEIALTDVNLTLRRGEILGIAGVAGNGQNELLEALSGERRSSISSSISLEGTAIGKLGPAERRRRGLCFVPEDRLGHGSVATMNLVENTILTTWDRAENRSLGLLRYERARQFAQNIIKHFDVRTSGVKDQANQLSGGNLQKFIIGREVLKNPQVLVVAHPTWGVDAAAALAIRAALIEVARQGAGVIVVSQDLDELLDISNRLVVMNSGNVSEALSTEAVDAAEIGMLMAGNRAQSGTKSSVDVTQTGSGHALAN